MNINTTEYIKALQELNDEIHKAARGKDFEQRRIEIIKDLTEHIKSIKTDKKG